MKELLIERITNFNITPTMLEESVKNNGGRLIVQGLVQLNACTYTNLEQNLCTYTNLAQACESVHLRTFTLRASR
jgi:hypothetical protein